MGKSQLPPTGSRFAFPRYKSETHSTQTDRILLLRVHLMWVLRAFASRELAY